MSANITHTNVQLTLDGDVQFEAHALGDSWNGWLAPLFTFEQVIALKKWFENGEQGTITYDGFADTFKINYSFDDDEFDTVTGTVGADGVRVYEWISFGWTFSEAGE
jgi:hypothetical protein